MKSRLLSRVLVALGLTVGTCAAPLESSACCLWPRSNTTYYAPAAVLPVAPACNTCNYAPQCNTCNYVPQVAYRSVFTSVPVTTYRPMLSADPCTGCATTVMRPVTVYQMQPRLVPYTSYRPVATCGYAPSCPTGAFGQSACATGNCGVPVAAPIAATYYQPAAPACSSCNGAAGGNTFAPPTLGAPSSTVVPSLSPQSTLTPLPDASSSTAPPQTFRPNTAIDTTPLVRPIPDLNGAGGARNSNTIVPRVIDPLDRNTARPRQDRLTARPIQNSWSVQPASHIVPVAASDERVEEGNWHRASR